MASLAIFQVLLITEIFRSIEREDKLFYIIFRITGVLISFFNIKRPNVRYRLKNSKKF